MKCTPHKKIPPSVLPGTSPIGLFYPYPWMPSLGLMGSAARGSPPLPAASAPPRPGRPRAGRGGGRGGARAPPLARLPPEAFPCVLLPPAAAGGGGGGNGDILVFYYFIL